MSGVEPVDELADLLRRESHGADPRVTSDLVEAADGEHADADLAVVATSALQAGMVREDLIRACDAARLAIRTRAGAARNFDDVAEDHVLELMDRLVGWCQRDARL